MSQSLWQRVFGPSREQRLIAALADERSAVLAMAERAIATQAQTNADLAKAVVEQGASFGKYLDSFKVNYTPSVHVMNDEIEAENEAKRLEEIRGSMRKMGLATHATPVYEPIEASQLAREQADLLKTLDKTFELGDLRDLVGV